MNKEIYRILKEISSLDQKTSLLRDDIERELERLAKIENQTQLKQENMENAQQKLKELKTEIQQLENDYQSLGKLKEDSEEKLAHITTEKQQKTLQDQIKQATEKVELLNDHLFERLELQDELEQEIEEFKLFINGVQTGKAEIKADIDLANEPRSKQIQSYKTRIENLTTQLPGEISEHFTKLRNKNLPKGAITFLTQDNYCQICGSQTEAPKAKEIEAKLKYSTCSNCMRVIIPNSTQYG